MGWDEENNRIFGGVTLDHVLGQNPNAPHYQNPWHFWNPVRGQFALTHGQLMEVALVAVERLIGLTEIRRVLLLRHLATFLIFYLGVVILYLLCRQVMGPGWYPLLGALLLVLSPRIFAHAFVNSYDTSFMMLYALCTLTLVRYLQRLSAWRAVAHGVACALLIDVRVAGMIMPAITLLTLLLGALCAPARAPALKRAGATFALYLVALVPLMILCWPLLWSDPPGQLPRSATGVQNTARRWSTCAAAPQKRRPDHDLHPAGPGGAAADQVQQADPLAASTSADLHCHRAPSRAVFPQQPLQPHPAAQAPGAGIAQHPRG